MRLTPLRRSGLLGAATMAAVATLTLVTTAFATPDKPVLNSGDPRAVAYDKNVAPGHADVCTVGGLTGTVVAKAKLTFTGGGEQDQYLNITAVDAGVTVTGVVVKGGDAFNVYLAAKLGPLPWNQLRSPDNNGGNIPTISHWYACGIDKQTSTSSSSSATSSSSSSSSAPSSTAASSSVAATTTTNAAAAPGTNELASTGFGSAWLVGIGAALLAAGVAVLLVLRRRSA
jgi:LPXTG-motif cell wall-anchored protein